MGKLIKLFVVVAFVTSLVVPPYAEAQNVIGVPAVQTLNLPVPGALLNPTSSFNPPIIKGLKLYPDNPLRFDFMMDTGDDRLEGPALEAESNKLIKYFLAALTTPEDEMWVNLSPYEKDRIIPAGFGRTEMGSDLLAQDYLLKQLTASLMYPEEELGREFWKRVYAKAQAKYGTTDIPVNTFNKVWIVPEKAVVYTHDRSAFVIESHLKVMLEEDYLSMKMEDRKEKIEEDSGSFQENQSSNVYRPSSLIKEILIPEIEREVNEGKTFANLRQIYYAVILASWYKQNLKESLLGHLYINQNKTSGVDTGDREVNQKIYQQYLEAFKKGVVDLIKEDYNPDTQQVIQRKYFSGGAVLGRTQQILKQTADSDEAMSATGIGRRNLPQMDRGFMERGFIVSTDLRGAPQGSQDPLAVLVARNNGERKPLEVLPVTDKAETQEEDLKKFSERDRAIIDKFNKLQGVTKVVDMGSGIGEFSAVYRERFPNDAIIGYEMDELTAGKMFDADWQVLGDAGHTGLLSESVDKVTINMLNPKDVNEVIPHLVEEARRILKPGGEIYIVFEVSDRPHNLLIGKFVRRGERVILGVLRKLDFVVEHAGVPLGEVDPNYPRTGMVELYEGRHGGINLFKARLPSTDEESATNTAKPDSAQSASVSGESQEEQQKKDHQAYLEWARGKMYPWVKKNLNLENINLRYEQALRGNDIPWAMAVNPLNGKLYVHFHQGSNNAFQISITDLPTLDEAAGHSIEEIAQMINIKEEDVFVSMVYATWQLLMIRLIDVGPSDPFLQQYAQNLINEVKLKIARDLNQYWEGLNQPPLNVAQEQDGLLKLRSVSDALDERIETRKTENRELKIIFPGVKEVPIFELMKKADKAQNASILEKSQEVQRKKDHQAFLEWARGTVYAELKKNLNSESAGLEYEITYAPSSYEDIVNVLAVDPESGKLFVHFHEGYSGSFEFGISALPTLNEAEGRTVEEVAQMIVIEDRDVFVSMFGITNHILMLRLADIKPEDQSFFDQYARERINQAKLKLAHDLKLVWQALREPPSNIFQENEGFFKLRISLEASKARISTRKMEGRELKIVFSAVKVPGFALMEKADKAQNASANTNKVERSDKLKGWGIVKSLSTQEQEFSDQIYGRLKSQMNDRQASELAKNLVRAKVETLSYLKNTGFLTEDDVVALETMNHEPQFPQLVERFNQDLQRYDADLELSLPQKETLKQYLFARFFTYYRYKNLRKVFSISLAIDAGRRNVHPSWWRNKGRVAFDYLKVELGESIAKKWILSHQDDPVGAWTQFIESLGDDFKKLENELGEGLAKRWIVDHAEPYKAWSDLKKDFDALIKEIGKNNARNWIASHPKEPHKAWQKTLERISAQDMEDLKNELKSNVFKWIVYHPLNPYQSWRAVIEKMGNDFQKLHEELGEGTAIQWIMSNPRNTYQSWQNIIRKLGNNYQILIQELGDEILVRHWILNHRKDPFEKWTSEGRGALSRLTLAGVPKEDAIFAVVYGGIHSQNIDAWIQVYDLLNQHVSNSGLLFKDISTRSVPALKTLIMSRFPSLSEAEVESILDPLAQVKAAAEEAGKDVGGIDLNPQMINLETQGEGSGFQSTFNPKDLEGIHINGLFPVIMNIVPITNVPQLMGIKAEPGEDKIAHALEISK